jgi:hypothetical protein
VNEFLDNQVTIGIAAQFGTLDQCLQVGDVAVHIAADEHLGRILQVHDTTAPAGSAAEGPDGLSKGQEQSFGVGHGLIAPLGAEEDSSSPLALFTANAENFLWAFLQEYATGAVTFTAVGWARGLKFRGFSGQPGQRMLSYQRAILHRMVAVEYEEKRPPRRPTFHPCAERRRL